jgi:hypothetical protein
LDRALSCLNRAIHIDADLAIAHWNRAFIHLLRGDWLNGWQDFEWRFQIPQWQTIYPHRIKGILWTGDVMPDHTILIHDEQGLGDTFQFVRYLNWVKQCFGKVILETRKELVSLLSNCSCIDQIIARSPDGPPPVPFDRYAPLMSLPRIFQTTPDRIPGTNAYIAAPKEKLDQWRYRLPSKGFKVGLVWAGRPEHVNDANRSCTLDQISALFQLQEIEFFGLQKGPAADQANQPSTWPNFSNLGQVLEDFADTAGILAHLDMVITVDTSVAHLAGAMGRPVWVLVPFIPDWRWMIKTEQSPWYPTMRLFRQARPDAWEPVIAQIKTALTERYHKMVTCHDRKTAR